VVAGLLDKLVIARGTRPRCSRCSLGYRSSASSSSFVLLVAHEPHSNQSRGKPEDCADEGKGFSCPPAAAEPIIANLMEIERSVIAVALYEIDEDAEDREPCKGDEDVDWPCVEGARGGDEPDQGNEYRDACNYYGIDEACQRPVDCASVVIEVVSDNTSDGLS
jgi:hypothetical protein